ncbi:MAG: hypothetical protein K2J36_09215 [Ruminococcus sp.]|nr:hypothetical protein [Ruminococcus sp.]MDE6798174.1 hypothetical protein [Ruminococcus sp.]
MYYIDKNGDDVSDYDGVHGLFYHKTPDGIYIKLGYYEGFVDAKTWLAVQDKKSHNHKFPNNSKVMNSWLVGIMKCRNCGYAMHINHITNKKGKTYRHFLDYGKYTAKGCVHTDKVAIRPDDVEKIRTEILRYDDEIRKLMEKLADADAVLFNYIQQRVSVLHAVTMIDVVYVSDENGVEVKFSI